MEKYGRKKRTNLADAMEMTFVLRYMVKVAGQLELKAPQQATSTIATKR